MWWMCMVSAMYWNANIEFTPLLGNVLLRVPIALGKLSLLHLCTKTYTTHFPSWNQIKLRAVSLGRKSHCIGPNPMSVPLSSSQSSLFYKWCWLVISRHYRAGVFFSSYNIILWGVGEAQQWCAYWQKDPSYISSNGLILSPLPHSLVLSQLAHSEVTATDNGILHYETTHSGSPVLRSFLLWFVIISGMDVAGLVSVSSSDINRRNAFKCNFGKLKPQDKGTCLSYCLVRADAHRVRLVTKEGWVLSVMPFIEFSEKIWGSRNDWIYVSTWEFELWSLIWVMATQSYAQKGITHIMD